jgi:hypothetical protein
MTTTYLAWDYVIDVHLTLICTTDLAYTTITLEHTLTLFSIASAVQLI